MSDAEIGALRAKLASRPRSDDYRQRRKDIDARGLAYGLVADVGVEPVTANGVKAEWTATPKDARDAALLYLHGGGYVIGSLDSHRHLAAEAGRAAGIAALALDYRLAPEDPFPAAVDDALATVFCWAEESHQDASRSPATAPAAVWSSQRCWRSAKPACRNPAAVGASRLGSTWRRSARR
jgi:acetyl esterase/lipase